MTFFDPLGDVKVTKRNLPHWEQAGRTYFITFRTEDSLPAPVLNAWRDERNQWLARHRVAVPRAGEAVATDRLPVGLRDEYRARFAKRFDELLDGGHGECVLKRPEMARVVADSLLHFDGQRYQMGDFVVMPNHVHLLVRFATEIGMRQQCRSWKKYTATGVNAALGRQGHFWQGESYDHLVRDRDEFERFRNYIADNPVKARLHVGEYLLYRGPDEL